MHHPDDASPSANSNTPPSFFSSRRERWLWGWALFVVVVIFATLGLARRLAGTLRDQGLISDAFWAGLILIAAAVFFQGIRMRLRGIEIGVALGVAGAYLIAFLRMAVPEERSHLIEYSIVALLVYEALTERRTQGRRVPAPELLAVLITLLVGVVDEGIQAVLPTRVFDPIDILFDLIASVMAVGGSAALGWVRRRAHR